MFPKQRKKKKSHQLAGNFGVEDCQIFLAKNEAEVPCTGLDSLWICDVCGRIFVCGLPVLVVRPVTFLSGFFPGCSLHLEDFRLRVIVMRLDLSSHFCSRLMAEPRL